MKHLLLIVLLFIVSFGYTQENRLDKLETLQKQLDQIKQASPEIIKDSLESLKLERDSLKLSLEVVRLELLLSQNKMQKLQNELDECRGSEIPLNGYFVVVESYRTEAEVKEQFAILRSKFHGYKFKYSQNSKKTWYHILLLENHERAAIGHAVQKARNEGFENAWWIRVE